MGFFFFFPSTQLPYRFWVPEALTQKIKRPVFKANHSPPYSAKIKNEWSYTTTPPIRLHGVVLN